MLTFSRREMECRESVVVHLLCRVYSLFVRSLPAIPLIFIWPTEGMAHQLCVGYLHGLGFGLEFQQLLKSARASSLPSLFGFEPNGLMIICLTQEMVLLLLHHKQFNVPFLLDHNAKRQSRPAWHRFHHFELDCCTC